MRGQWTCVFRCVAKRRRDRVHEGSDVQGPDGAALATNVSMRGRTLKDSPVAERACRHGGARSAPLHGCERPRERRPQPLAACCNAVADGLVRE